MAASAAGLNHLISFPKKVQVHFGQDNIYAQDYSPVIYNSWVCYLNGQYFYTFYGAEAYVGPYDLGEKIYPTFTTLTWEAGENHLYK